MPPDDGWLQGPDQAVPMERANAGAPGVFSFGDRLRMPLVGERG